MGVKLTGRFYHDGFVGYRARGAKLSPWMAWSANSTTLAFPQRPASATLNTADFGDSSLWFSNSYTETSRRVTNAIGTSAMLSLTNDPAASPWFDNSYTATLPSPAASYPSSSTLQIAQNPTPSPWFDLSYTATESTFPTRPNSALSDNTP